MYQKEDKKLEKHITCSLHPLRSGHVSSETQLMLPVLHNKVTISTSTPSPRVLPPLSASKALSLPFPRSFSKNHSSVVKEDERVGIVCLFLKCAIEFACFSVPDSEYQIKTVKLLFHLPPYYRCAKIPIKKSYTIGKQLRNHCCFSCQSVLSHCFHSVPYLPVLSK